MNIHVLRSSCQYVILQIYVFISTYIYLAISIKFEIKIIVSVINCHFYYMCIDYIYIYMI